MKSMAGGGGMDQFVQKQYQAKKAKQAAEKQARLMAALYASSQLKKVDVLVQDAEGNGEEEVIELTFDEKVERDLNEVKNSGKPLTKITLENFLAWKTQRMKRKKKELFEQKKGDLKKAGHKRGLKGLRTGLELFKTNAELFQDDNDATGEERTFEVEDPTMKKHNIDDYALRMPTLMKADHEESEDITENVQVDEDAFADVDLGDDDDFDDDGDDLE